jgi:hypothetical protein
MRYPLIVALALGLALAFPAPARAESYLSLLWADRPVTLLLPALEIDWRVRLRYNVEWQPPVSWSPSMGAAVRARAMVAAVPPAEPADDVGAPHRPLTQVVSIVSL